MESKLDGQVRRQLHLLIEGSSSPLGELFDHGITSLSQNNTRN
jgi:hypothetical protein